MPSQFDAEFAETTPDFLALYGELVAVTLTRRVQRFGYQFQQNTPLGWTGSIMAIVLRETRSSEGEFQAQNFYNTLQIQISARTDLEGIVSPREIRKGGDFDVFEVDGKSWGLRRILERNIGGMHTLLLWDGGAESL